MNAKEYKRAQRALQQRSTFEQAPTDVVPYVARELDTVLHITAQLQTPGGAEASLSVGFSMDRFNAERRRTLGVVATVAISIIALGLLLAWLVGTVMVRPITNLTHLTSDIVTTGNLTQAVEVNTRDEVRELASSFLEMVGGLRSILIGVNETMAKVLELSSNLSRTGSTVLGGAESIYLRAEETAELVSQMHEHARGVEGNVEVLQDNTERASSSIIQMATTNSQVAQNVDSMAESTRATAESMEKMSASSTQVATRLEELTTAMSATAASMSEMYATIREIEGNVGRTAELADRVTTSAVDGVRNIQDTLGGFEKIRSSAGAVSRAINVLGERAESVGEIVNVIDTIANETNLLALNASIIAAQAGAHGKGFAVVADEIKELAARTRASTTEIGELIHAIQQEIEAAIEAVDRQVAPIDDGSRLAEATSESLHIITDSSRATTEMARQIAKATEQQTKGSSEVSLTLDKISQAVEEISHASNDHALGVQAAKINTARVNELTQEVRSATQIQSRGSEEIIASIHSINFMITELRQAQGRQKGVATRVLDAVQVIRNASTDQRSAVKDLDSAITALEARSRELKEKLERFRV
jgi:methyl-accepting chemotaxis protein